MMCALISLIVVDFQKCWFLFRVKKGQRVCPGVGHMTGVSFDVGNVWFGWLDANEF